MRFLLSTMAGLALVALALAPPAQAQNRAAAAPDLDSQREPLAETPSIREAYGADQDIPGQTLNHVATRVQDTGSDQDDVTTSPRAQVRPLGLNTVRLEYGREDAAPVLVIQISQPNLHPDGREPGLAVAAKAAGREGPRTMTEDGRALDVRPGAPVLDEALPEAEVAEAAKTETAPMEVALGAVSPNPVEETARLTFTLPASGAASLVLFDVQGRAVATLFEGLAPEGPTAVTLDARGLASGTYVAVLETGGARVSQRLQVVR